jgi:S-adenosylmethionine:tRNA ribosyltransferase-isomerase
MNAATLSAATTSARRPDTKLLVIERGRVSHRQFTDLPAHLRAGDLLVVNDAATIPASLSGFHRATGAPVEARLASAINAPARWLAVLFGAGDWRTPTEKRQAPPSVRAGDLLDFRFGLTARIAKTRPESPRLVELELVGEPARLWGQIYRAGAPIQYSYLREPLALWDGQTVFAGPPAALEPPSASFPFTWKLVFELKKRGVGLAYLTHEAGISTTGDAELDAKLLPLPERYEIPESTARAVNRALKENQRVIAAGTTVTRALESAATDRQVQAGPGVARLKITPEHERKVVSGLITGLHEKGASHLKLLASFAPAATIERAYSDAASRGYLWHEYGDSCLISSEDRVLHP